MCFDILNLGNYMASVLPAPGLQIPVWCLPPGQNFRVGIQIPENLDAEMLS